MKYYLYQPDANRYTGIRLEASWQTIPGFFFKEETILPEWVPLAATEVDSGVPGDFPSLTNFKRVPVFSKRAWTALSPIISNCEELPIIHPSDDSYVIIHPLKALDCLDISRCIVKRFEDGGIMRITKYAFKNEALESNHFFRLPFSFTGALIVDEVFRDTVQKNCLQGLIFKDLPT